MGFGKWLKNTVGDFKESDYYFKLGCEVMGPPQGMRGMGTPLERSERIEAGKKEAARRAREEQFGTGDVYGDENWTPPIYATTRDGRPVTVSFGQGNRPGQTLICDGHVSRQEFYEKRRNGLKGHDHYLVDGKPGGRGDRGRYAD